MDKLKRETDNKRRHRTARQLKQLRLKLKSEFFGRRADAINNAAEMRHIEEEYRLAREQKLIPKASSSVGCPANLLHKHFTKHFEAKPSPDASETLKTPKMAEVIPEIDIEIDDGEPTWKEVERAIKELKNGRCLGVDGIASEHLKYAETTRLTDWMHALFKRVWSHGECPSTWTKSRLKPLYKNKGSMSDPKMYRGLMINSTINKVLVMIILARLREHYEQAILPNQYGFRSNKSTTDGVFLAKQITENTPSDVWGCFIDLKAAYDWVHRTTLWEVLRLRLGKSGGKLVDILEQLYRVTTADLDGCKEPVDVLIGLRQGAAEGCVLFNY